MIIVKTGRRKIEQVLKEYRQKLIKVKQLHQIRDKKAYTKKSTRRREEIKLAKYKNKRNHDEF